MRNYPGPRRSIGQHVQQQWSCFDQSPSGRLLVVEPDYLPDSEVCFNRAWTPFPNGGVWGGLVHPQLSSGGSREGGKDNFCIPPPLQRIQEHRPRIKILGKIAL
jgi:hypothetical protein